MALQELIYQATKNLHEYKHPHELLSRGIRKPKCTIEEYKELVNEYIRLERQFSNLIYSYTDLVAKATKLEAENEFMIKQINIRLKEDESN